MPLNVAVKTTFYNFNDVYKFQKIKWPNLKKLKNIALMKTGYQCLVVKVPSLVFEFKEFCQSFLHPFNLLIWGLHISDRDCLSRLFRCLCCWCDKAMWLVIFPASMASTEFTRFSELNISSSDWPSVIRRTSSTVRLSDVPQVLLQPHLP